MAVVIPLAMAYAGTFTAAQIAFTTIALAATGASAKVDKAAGRVFGEDTVKFANIAGAIYMAGSGMLTGGEASAAGGTAAAPDMSSAIAAAGDGGGAATTAAMGGPEAALSAVSGAGDSSTAAMTASNVSNAAPALQPQPQAGPVPQPKVAPPPNAGSSLADLPSRAADAFGRLDPRVQAALVQVGGGALSGYAQGKAREEELDRMEAENRRYRSGSNLPYWARSAIPIGGAKP
jgi:hypothetical protein